MKKVPFIFILINMAFIAFGQTPKTPKAKNPVVPSNIIKFLPKAATIQTGTYIIKSAIGGKNMDVMWGENKNGAGIHLWDATGGDAQQFTIEPTNEASYYYIKTKWGRAVDVAGYNRNSGASLNTYDVHGGDNQKWQFFDIGNGYYNIMSKYGTYIDVQNANSASGTPIWMYSYSTADNIAQRWKLEKLVGLGGIRINPNNIVPIMATVYSNANFQGTNTTITATGRKSVTEIGLPFVNSIKVSWGYKAIVSYNTLGKGGVTNTNQMEIVGDRETLPIIKGKGGAYVNVSSVTAIEIVAYTPLSGFVDMHTHLMSHLSMGGKVMYGVPDENSFFLRGTQYRGFDVFKKECNDDVQVRGANFKNAFFNCNAIHGSPGTDNDCGDIIRSQSVNKLDEKYTKKFRTHLGKLEDHPHSGIENWPHWSSATHQQMWWEWIKRAKEGGLKVMVALGVQNSLLAKTAHAEEYIDDKSSVELQLREIRRFVMDHNDFMEIARTPQDLRRIVGSDKLAVILGVETEDIGNLTRRKHFNNENITIDQVREELRNLYDNYDVRYVFPIHVSNNIFGGAALYKDLFLLTSKYYTNNYPSVTEVSNEAISFKLARNSFEFPEGDLLKSRNLG